MTPEQRDAAARDRGVAILRAEGMAVEPRDDGSYDVTDDAGLAGPGPRGWVMDRQSMTWLGYGDEDECAR